MRIESFSPTQTTIAPASLTGKRGRFPYNPNHKTVDTQKPAPYSIHHYALYVFNHRFFTLTEKIAIFA